MNRSTIIIVVSGFFFALLAAFAVQMVGGKNKKDDTAQARMIDVLVAAKDLKIGEELTPGATGWSSWPENAVFSGAILREGTQGAGDALKGRVARSFAKGEPMLKSGMVASDQPNFVAASLTPGKRAISLNVKADSSVAGFLMAGDHVDVILTYDVKLPSDEKIRKAAMPVITKMASETILENLRVVATDQDSKKTEPKISKTVTLEVDPRQAEQLVLAGKMGALSLALRSIGDETPAHAPNQITPATTDMRLSGVMREIMKGENNSGSLSQVVRVYSGTRVENVEVRPYSQ